MLPRLPSGEGRGQGNSQDSKVSAIIDLAEAAGLMPRWSDYRNDEHAVSEDSLRTILAALGLPAGSPGGTASGTDDPAPGEAPLRPPPPPRAFPPGPTPKPRGTRGPRPRPPRAPPPPAPATTGRATKLPVPPGPFELTLEYGGTR